jgi:hypothetical protein
MKRKVLNLQPAIPGKQPGYWVNRTQLNSIGKYCQNPIEPKLVYLALSRVMNERKSRRFCPGGDVRQYCGITRNRIEKAYRILERAGVITRDWVVNPPGIPKAMFITLTGEVRYE